MTSPAARILASSYRHRHGMARVHAHARVRVGAGAPVVRSISMAGCRIDGHHTCTRTHTHTHTRSQPLQLQVQKRSYLYIPTSWLEAQERFRRWRESAKHTVVNVQLISTKKTRERLKDIMKNPTRTLTSKFMLKGKQRGQRFVRRMNQSQWNSWILRQRKKLKNSWSTTTIDSTSLPLPASTPSSVRERYQNFKLRRREQYQRFKTKRQEQLKRFTSGRREAWIRTKQILVDEYSRPEWFDELGRPLVAKDVTGRFVNPWKSQSTNGIQSVATILKWRVERMIRTWNQLGLFRSLVPRLSWNNDYLPPLPQPSLPLPEMDDSKIQLTWIGHSTCWVQMNNLTILTDPMFSLRASPYQWLPIGVPREVPPSHSIQELAQHSPSGKIDLLCISHDHYGTYRPPYSVHRNSP
jgi:hypothetical protein